MENSKIEPIMNNRPLNWIGCCILVLTVLGGLLLWRPGFGAWAIVSVGILLSLTLYMVEAIVNTQNRLPSNKLQAIFLSIAGIVILHLFAMWMKITPSTSCLGAIGSSVVFQFALISAGVLLVQVYAWQDVFLQFFKHASVCLLMIGCSIAGIAIAGPTTRAQIGCVPIFLAGACVVTIWSLGLIKKYSPNAFSGFQNVVKEKVLKVLYLSVAIVFSLLLLLFISLEAFLIAILVAIFCIGLYYLTVKHDTAKPAWIFTCIWSLISVITVVATKPVALEVTLFGFGERGFYAVSAINPGAHVLLSITGLLGLIIFIAGVFGICCWLVTGAKRGFPRQIIRAAISAASLCLAAGAFLSTGGFSTPVSTLAIIIAGGLLYQNAGIEKFANENSVAKYSVKTAPGIYIVCALAGVFAVAGIAGFPGLLGEMGIVFGLNDKSIHMLSGAIIALVLSWWLGKFHWLLGFVGIGLACGVGYFGEYIQGLVSTGRGSEDADANKHLYGCIIGAGVYIAGVLGRLSICDIASKKNWHRASWKFYVGWVSRTLVPILIFLPICLWTFEIISYSAKNWSNGVPGIILGDMIANKKNSSAILPARSKNRSNENASKLYTQQFGAKNILLCFNKVAQNYILNTLYFSKWKLNKSGQFVIGAPYSKFAYVDTSDLIVDTISSDDTLLIINAKDIVNYKQELTADLLYNKLRNDYGKAGRDCRIVFLHPGPPESFELDKVKIKKRFPKIPLICDTNYMATEAFNPKSFTIPQKQSYHSAYSIYLKICYYKKVENHDKKTGKVSFRTQMIPPSVLYLGTDSFMERYFRERRMKNYRGAVVIKNDKQKIDPRARTANSFLTGLDILFAE